MKNLVLDCPRAVLNAVEKFRRNISSHQLIFYLNHKHAVLDTREFYVNEINQSKIKPGDLLTPALLLGCNNIIVVHFKQKHGFKYAQSLQSTVTLLQYAGLLLEIELIDYLLVSATQYYSFRESGLL